MNKNSPQGTPLTPSGLSVRAGSASDFSHYAWIEENRTRGFDSLKAEIEHVESLGYALVPPEYKIQHWSEAMNSRVPPPSLFVNTLDGVRPFTATLDRYAAELGYPLFFQLNTKVTNAGAKTENSNQHE